MNDREIYDAIAKELNEGKEEGLWLQCEVEANMDEKITKKLYVEKRFKEIKAETEGKKNEFKRVGVTEVEHKPKENTQSQKKEKKDKVVEAPKKLEKNFSLVVCPDIDGVSLKVSKIFIKINDQVKKGEVLCDIENEDTVYEVESPYSGKIINVFIKQSDPLDIQQNLFEIDESIFNETKKEKVTTNLQEKDGKPFQKVKNITALKEFSEIYHKYKIIDFSDDVESNLKIIESNRKLLFDGIKILSEISKDLDPNIPTTYITSQIVDQNFVSDEKYVEVQLNLKELHRYCIGVDELELFTRVLRMYPGFNNEDLQ